MTRQLGRSIALATVLALPVAAPTALHAQNSLAWTMCTPDGFHSCHSVQLTTLALMSGADRVGTGITITMHNLNGQILQDNTLWSGLKQVSFEQVREYGTGFYNQWPASVTLNGSGASGHADGLAVESAGGVFEDVDWYSSYDVIGGCNPGQQAIWYGNLATSAFTCGSGATASVSFSTNLMVDATGHWMARIYAVGDALTVTNNYVGCRSSSGGNWANSGMQQCDVLSGDSSEDPIVSLTPEPVTLVLLGSGLFGLGAARLRRKKDPQIDA